MHPRQARAYLRLAWTTALASGSVVVAQYNPHPEGIDYTEPYRPQYHFSPRSEWMNDINALMYQGGRYHMIYQWGEAKRHGGYATSPDLLHWNDEGVALIPQKSFLPSEAKRNVSGAEVYSGSGVVVSGETARKITGSEREAMVVIYTGTELGTCLAWSNDSGRTWHDYAGNPVGHRTQGADPRDPCVFWHEPTQKWILALYERGTTFYGSGDLIEWTFLSNIDFGFECHSIEKRELLGKELRPDAVNRLEIRMLVDWSSLEVFAAGGVFSYSQQFAFLPEDAGLQLYTNGGEVQLVSLELNEVARIWPDAGP